MSRKTLRHHLGDRGLRLGDLARLLRVHKATVTRWDRSGVPVDHLKAVSSKTGIPARLLRPDLAEIIEEGAAA